jgi:flagellar biosynthesis protein FlhG
VLAGNCSLEEILLDAPQGFKVVPAASGIAQLAELDTLTHVGWCARSETSPPGST